MSTDLVEFVTDTPWQKSGVEGDVDTRWDKQAFAEKVGLDWHGTKQALTTVSRAQAAVNYAFETDPSPGEVCPEVKPATDFYSVERSDTGHSLGVVKGRYEMLQPSQALDWFTPWLDSRALALHSAGVLEGGAKMWILAQVLEGGTFADIVPGDSVARFMLLFNSFDGSSSVMPMFSPIRMWCSNQLPQVKRTAERLMSIRHTAVMHDSLEHVRKVMELARQDFDEVVDQYRILAGRQVQSGQLRTYIRTVLGIGRKKDGTFERFEDLSARAKNTVQRVEGMMETRPNVAGTWYGALNAVNGYLNHQAGNNEDSRLRNLFFGQNVRRNLDSLKTALEMAA